MPQPTGSDIHIDSILTNFAAKYGQEQGMFIGNQALSNISVQKKSDYYFVYDKGPFFRDDMEQRAPGTEFARTGWTVSTASYKTVQRSLEVPIADEDRANADTPIDLDRDASELLMQQNLIRMERELATVGFSTTAWTSSDASATNWENASGVPVTAVQRAQREVQRLTGLIPNSLMCGLIVGHALQTNDQIQDMLKYTQRNLPRDQRAILAQALGLENIYISQASYDTTNEATTDSPTMTRIIDDDAIVYYRNPTPGIRRPTAISLFYWEPGGGLGVFERYREDKIKSDIARMYSEWTMHKVSADLGYGFFDIVD